VRINKELLLMSFLLTSCQADESASRSREARDLGKSPQMLTQIFSGFIGSFHPAPGTCFAPKAVLTSNGELVEGLPSFADVTLDSGRFSGVLREEAQATSEYSTAEQQIAWDTPLVLRDYGHDFVSSQSDLLVTLGNISKAGQLDHYRVKLKRARVRVDSRAMHDTFELTNYGKSIRAESLAMYLSEPDKAKATRLAANNILAKCGNHYVYEITSGTVVDYVIDASFASQADTATFKRYLSSKMPMDPVAFAAPHDVKFTGTIWAPGLTDALAQTIDPEFKRVVGTDHGYPMWEPCS
jgi:hypothetical protein